MNFRDRWETNEAGEKFLFTVEMQRKLHEAGLPPEPASLAHVRAQFIEKAAPPREKERRRDSRREDIRDEEVVIDPATGKYIGRLIMFDGNKGFGFITRGADKIYFHQRKALDDPNHFSEGQKLLYDTDLYRGKEEAINVEEYVELAD